jgi:hypothetical protein
VSLLVEAADDEGKGLQGPSDDIGVFAPREGLRPRLVCMSGKLAAAATQSQ